MILVEGEKYACERCIRGHRSSTCSHIKRPLVLVRSRGRPLNTTQRIAIFAEELEKDSQGNYNLKKHDIGRVDGLADGENAGMESKEQSTSCCSAKKNEDSSSSSPSSLASSHCCQSRSSSSKPGTSSSQVIMLKASKRQVFNVAKGPLKLLQPISDIPNNEVGLEMIRKMAKKRESKHGKSCCTKKTPIRMNESIKQDVKLSAIGNILKGISSPNSSSLTVGSRVPSTSTVSQSSSTDNLKILSNNLATGRSTVYDMYVADSCTVPGSCCCEDNACTCVGCLVHNAPVPNIHSSHPNTNTLHNHVPNYANGQMTASNVHMKSTNSDTNSTFSNMDDYQSEVANMLLFGQVQMQSFVPKDPQTQQLYQYTPSSRSQNYHDQRPDNSQQQYQALDNNGALPNDTGNHVVFPMLSAQNINASIDEFFNDYSHTNGHNHNPLVSIPSTPSSDLSSPSLTAMSDCQCNDDDCACYYCEKHGIYKGVRLADGVIVNTGESQSNIGSTDTTVPLDTDNDSEIDLNHSSSHGLSDRMVKMEIDNNSNSLMPTPSSGDDRDAKNSSSCCGGGGDRIKVKQEEVEVVPTTVMNDIQASANAFLDSLDLSEFQDYCCCPDDNCNCTNCFKHGRFGDSIIYNN